MLAFALTVLASGLIKLLVIGRGQSAAHYLATIASSLLVAMFWAVILAVWWERPWQAPVFLSLAAIVGALLFYRTELFTGYLPLATNVVIVIAITVWVLATVGCALRQRLRAMD